jgi:murein DD-endopeptidase MepM/ murein hydrolase activator NlpD
MTRALSRVLLTTILILGAVAVGALAAGAMGASGAGRHSRTAPPSAVLPAPTSWLLLPVPGPAVLGRPFAPPPRPWLPGHRGVDLIVPPGTTVRAAAAGVVVYAGDLAGRLVVSVAHVGGLRTTYEPVRPSVATGARVAAGQAIGVVEAGHPGCAGPACLHWGARIGETYVDPMALLGPPQVRLKPLSLARAEASAGIRAQALGWAWS